MSRTWTSKSSGGDAALDRSIGDRLKSVPGEITRGVDATEEDAAVMPAKPHGIGERDVDHCLARLVGHVVEIAGRILRR